MIHKFVDFLCVTAGILVVLSLVQQVKKDFEDIKTSQAMQLVMLEKLVLLQTVDREIKFVVFKIEKNEIYFLFLIDGVPQCMTARIDRVSTDYKFLGKSKANINDLFKVEDD